MKKIFNMAVIAVGALALAGCADPSLYSGLSDNSAPSYATDSQPDNPPQLVVEPISVYVPQGPNVVVVDPSESAPRRPAVESPRIEPPRQPEHIIPKPRLKPY